MADERPVGRYEPGSQGLAVLSDLMGRYLAYRGVSQTAFEGDRNYYTILGYPNEVTFIQAEAKYRRQDVARIVITAKPSATWKDGPDLQFVDDAKTGEGAQESFLAEWKALTKRVRLWDRLRRADIRAGLGQYSVVVLGFRGRGAWATPLKKKNSPGDLVYLAVYDEPDAKIETFETDPESERFNQPAIYSIDTGTADKVKTHWTKVIHIAEDPEKDDIYGTPRMEASYNLLDALMKVVHGGAEAVWHGMVGTFHADVREGYELTGPDEEKLTEAINEFLNGLRRVVQTEGVDLTRLAAQITDTSPSYEVCIELLCATTQIPRTIMIGSDRGDVSKTEETRRWASVIGERRQAFADSIIRTIIERLVDYGSLPLVDVDEIEIVWKPLFEISELERAGLAEARGRAVSVVSSGSSADVYVSPAEFREWLGLEARPEGENDVEQMGLRMLLAKIAQTLTNAGASLYAAALTAGFTEKEAKALVAWAAVPKSVTPDPVPGDTPPVSPEPDQPRSDRDGENSDGAENNQRPKGKAKRY